MVLSIVVIALGLWGLKRHQAGPRIISATSQTAGRAHARAEFAIEGMDCLLCAAGLQNKLRALHGVSQAGVSDQDKRATVEFDPAFIDRARLVAAIESDGLRVAAPQP